MEKIAILSDVHGNITALNAVLEDIEKREIKKIFCLGDSTAKLPNSDLVIDLLKEKCEVVLKGNCEVVLKGNCDENIAHPNIAKGRFWTRDKIGEERANYLYHLPVMHEFYLSGYLIRLFHASPFSLYHIFNPIFKNRCNRYENRQIDDYNCLFENTKFIGRNQNDEIPDVVGYGHLHTPNLFRYGDKTIFNPGSVGASSEMKNNSNQTNTSKFSTVASYMVLEGEYGAKELSALSFQLVRLSYDIQKEIENIEKSDMPGKEDSIRMLKTASPY
ncbi:MAG: metallophosphoesterase family protein [Clostridia bacterium]|nr:metallophosphoesterase family protein [Clostridia bacterium]